MLFNFSFMTYNNVKLTINQKESIMALKQADQIRYDSLVALITTLKNLGHDYHTILGAAAPQIKEFQDETGLGVRLKSNFDVELIDRRKDFLRIRSPNSESKVLRTKVDGVAIDVKIFKEGDYDFDNAAIEASLRALADEVSSIEKPLVDFPDCEVKEHIKEISEPSEGIEVSSDAEEADASGDDDAKEEAKKEMEEASAHPDSKPQSYVSEPETSEVARFEEETPESVKGSEFQFEGSDDFENSGTESEVDELFGS